MPFLNICVVYVAITCFLVFTYVLKEHFLETKKDKEDEKVATFIADLFKVVSVFVFLLGIIVVIPFGLHQIGVSTLDVLGVAVVEFCILIAAMTMVNK